MTSSLSAPTVTSAATTNPRNGKEDRGDDDLERGFILRCPCQRLRQERADQCRGKVDDDAENEDGGQEDVHHQHLPDQKDREKRRAGPWIAIQLMVLEPERPQVLVAFADVVHDLTHDFGMRVPERAISCPDP